MKHFALAVAAIAMASTAPAAPAFAQDNGSDARKILGRVLNAVLGEEEAADAEITAEDSTTETVAAPSAPMTASQLLGAAVASDARGDNAARDKYRHPVETLKFFKVKPGMTVIDMFPGGAYYTDILVPYLGADGSYIGGVTTIAALDEEQQARQRTFPERYPRLVSEAHAEAGISGAPISAINTEAMPDGIEGTVDRVLIFRMMHNFHRWNLAPEVLGKLRSSLKDDGILGIIQHRAKADAPYSYADGNKGYLRQQDVIKLVEAHGFDLVSSSEVNANPNDPANHTIGVWHLPPVLSGLEEENVQERAARMAIGESDRMTLMFKKRP